MLKQGKEGQEKQIIGVQTAAKILFDQSQMLL
jgi:hypothetical protein